MNAIIKRIKIEHAYANFIVNCDNVMECMEEDPLKITPEDIIKIIKSETVNENISTRNTLLAKKTVKKENNRKRSLSSHTELSKNVPLVKKAEDSADAFNVDFKLSNYGKAIPKDVYLKLQGKFESMMQQLLTMNQTVTKKVNKLIKENSILKLETSKLKEKSSNNLKAQITWGVQRNIKKLKKELMAMKMKERMLQKQVDSLMKKNLDNQKMLMTMATLKKANETLRKNLLTLKKQGDDFIKKDRESISHLKSLQKQLEVKDIKINSYKVQLEEIQKQYLKSKKDNLRVVAESKKMCKALEERGKLENANMESSLREKQEALDKVNNYMMVLLKTLTEKEKHWVSMKRNLLEKCKRKFDIEVVKEMQKTALLQTSLTQKSELCAYYKQEISKLEEDIKKSKNVRCKYCGF